MTAPQQQQQQQQQLSQHHHQRPLQPQQPHKYPQYQHPQQPLSLVAPPPASQPPLQQQQQESPHDPPVWHYCECCAAVLNSAKQYRVHVAGSRHRRTLQAVQTLFAERGIPFAEHPPRAIAAGSRISARPTSSESGSVELPRYPLPPSHTGSEQAPETAVAPGATVSANDSFCGVFPTSSAAAAAAAQPPLPPSRPRRPTVSVSVPSLSVRTGSARGGCGGDDSPAHDADCAAGGRGGGGVVVRRQRRRASKKKRDREKKRAAAVAAAAEASASARAETESDEEEVFEFAFEDEDEDEGACQEEGDRVVARLAPGCCVGRRSFSVGGTGRGQHRGGGGGGVGGSFGRGVMGRGRRQGSAPPV